MKNFDLYQSYQRNLRYIKEKFLQLKVILKIKLLETSSAFSGIDYIILLSS
jgi:hypothetical protein